MADDQSLQDAHKSLEFETDRGSSQGFWVALLLTVLIVAWMGSGFVMETPDVVQEVETIEVEPVAVSVQMSVSKPVTQFFQAEGQALPDRDTTIRAKSSGEIAEVLVKKGQDVEANAVIARFETSEREADIERARVVLERAQREFDNASTLRNRGIASENRVIQAEAALASAKAEVADAEETLDDTDITAPFAGRIETLDLDVGEFIQVGTEVGRIVDNTPLTIAIQVPQHALGQLQNLQPARVLFITGQERAGTVSFVGTSAATDTRTFLVEIDVPNADGVIPAGVSAEVQIPVGQLEAHFVSPSMVSLNENGALGVKTVDADNIVRFFEIEVVRAQIDGIWVQGLPDDARIITVGQGFVRDGELVRPNLVDGTQ